MGAGVGLAGALTFGLCMIVLPVPAHTAPWVVPLLATAAGVLVSILLMAVRHARRHSRLAGELLRRARPAAIDGMAVHELAGLDGALVAGLRHPRIYCARDLASRLTPDELRAVLLHERFHQLDRAPMKMVMLLALEPFARRVRSGSAWLAARMAALEIAADRHALERGASRSALAGALLKLAPARSGLAIGFTSAVDLRLRALLDDGTATVHARPAGWMLLALAVAVICVLLALVI